jgi:hypothetical protein
LLFIQMATPPPAILFLSFLTMSNLFRVLNNWIDALKSAIQLLNQWKCFRLQRGPLPDPYTAPCELSTVGSNAAGPFLVASSLPLTLWSSVHLWN